MKKPVIFLPFLQAVTLIVSSLTGGCMADPYENGQPTEPNISELGQDELLTFLLEKGLILPEYYTEHQEAAGSFVYKFTPLIMNSEIDATVGALGFDQSNDLLKNLYELLCQLGLVNAASR